MSKYDIESFFADLKVALPSAFNAAVTEVNADKGNAPFLCQQIDTNAVYLMTLDNASKQYDKFIFAYIEDVQSESNGRAVAQTFRIEVDFLYSWSFDTYDPERTLRYMRILKEAVQTFWGSIGKGYDRTEINSLLPILIKRDGESDAVMKAIGVQFDFTISD